MFWVFLCVVISPRQPKVTGHQLQLKFKNLEKIAKDQNKSMERKVHELHVTISEQAARSSKLSDLHMIWDDGISIRENLISWFEQVHGEKAMEILRSQWVKDDFVSDPKIDFQKAELDAKIAEKELCEAIGCETIACKKKKKNRRATSNAMVKPMNKNENVQIQLKDIEDIWKDQSVTNKKGSRKNYKYYDSKYFH